MTRWYIRCRDCLAIRAIDGAPPRPLQCECGGSLEIMGEVRATRLVHIEHGPPCDGRCTSARGPQCDCTCRGANHGSGLVVEIIREVGRPPRLRGADLATAEEWRSALRRATAAAERLPWGSGRIEVWDVIRSAERARSHRRRLQLLADAERIADRIGRR